MTEAEKLKRDIDTLKESIQLSWGDLERLTLTIEERRAIREHIEWLIQELHELIKRLDILDAQRT